MAAQKPTGSQEQQLLLTAVKITTKFRELGVFAKFVLPVSEGPIVSIFRFQPVGNTKVSQMEALSSDIAVALGVEDVLIKRLPGESSVACFVPNKEQHPLDFKDAIGAAWNVKDTFDVPLLFGVDMLGNSFVGDLVKLPHLLIAGSTGSGKSTLLSSIIAALIYCKSPEKISLILSDTKGVEFCHFIGAPHLLFPPATSVYQTLENMDWLLDEMERRLHLIGKAGCRNIHEYHNVSIASEMPFIILAIDELADLMLFRGSRRGESKISEEKLGKIVQKSRATGVHVIAATQRPSVNVVAGSLKANFPARLSFRLPSEADSRTVLGTSGAEHLLARGDMFYLSPLRPMLERLHAPLTCVADMEAAARSKGY